MFDISVKQWYFLFTKYEGDSVMKKVFSILLVFTLIFSCVGCGAKTQSMLPDEKSNEDYSATQSMSSPVETDEVVSEDGVIIYPLKQGIDMTNIEDAIIPISFNSEDFDSENKTLIAALYERDIYDAVDISNMKVGDSIVISDVVFPIEKITEIDEFIDINDGYTYSEFGMTFMPYEGGTYRTLLLDDYSTYTQIGDCVLNLSSDFELVDYMCGEPDNEGVKSNLEGLNDYFATLSEGFLDFGYSNTVAHIVNNEIVSIVRHWVP